MRQSNSGQDGKDSFAHDGGDERCGAGELHQGGDAENPVRAPLDQLAAEVRNNPFHTVLCRKYTDFKESHRYSILHILNMRLQIVP